MQKPLPARDLLARYLGIRKTTVDLCAPLETEDFVVQPVPEVSPPKWHLAHSSWFFEQLLLKTFVKTYQPFSEKFSELFNSYYNALGPHWAQGNRGALSRPTVAQVLSYRAHIDEQMQALLGNGDLNKQLQSMVVLGLHHEQQHQELLVMDIKYILGANRVATQYSQLPLPLAPAPESGWAEFAEGIYEIGHIDSLSNNSVAGQNFAFDNESPRHKTYVYPFAMARALVTSGDFLEFMRAGGYSTPKYWLSLGWEWVQRTHAAHPMYWSQGASSSVSDWNEYTLHGQRPLDLNAPLVHINYFEADAFARWKQARLPTEHEFEVFLQTQPATDQAAQTGGIADYLHPTNANTVRNQVWCWTQSSYGAYPGFQSFQGAVEEYNGKFMCNQYVLRSGCVGTPFGHYRDTYRNFYLPEQQWMFSGIRLARSAP